MNLKSVILKLAACIFLVAAGWLLFSVTTANFVGGGPDKEAYIGYTLMQIQAAKAEWAIVNGYTNASDMHREVMPQGITPYVIYGSVDKYGCGFDQNGYVRPLKGIFFPLTLWEFPHRLFLRVISRKTGGSTPRRFPKARP
jgi:hypothetical protein